MTVGIVVMMMIPVLWLPLIWYIVDDGIDLMMTVLMMMLSNLTWLLLMTDDIVVLIIDDGGDWWFGDCLWWWRYLILLIVLMTLIYTMKYYWYWIIEIPLTIDYWCYCWWRLLIEGVEVYVPTDWWLKLTLMIWLLLLRYWWYILLILLMTIVTVVMMTVIEPMTLLLLLLPFIDDYCYFMTDDTLIPDGDSVLRWLYLMIEVLIWCRWLVMYCDVP